MPVLSQTEVQKKYDRLSPIYDLCFSAILNAGRRDVIRRINQHPPSSILELGIGTGLSLGCYSPDHYLTGIDISAKMIRKARERKKRLVLANTTLLQMDAERLLFPDHAFDMVVALYVFSTTSHPQSMIAEASRVCRKGGRIFILNHFSHNSSPLARIEKALLPITRRIGWQSYFEQGQIALPTLRLVSNRKNNLLGYWQSLEYERI